MYPHGGSCFLENYSKKETKGTFLFLETSGKKWVSRVVYEVNDVMRIYPFGLNHQKLIV